MSHSYKKNAISMIVFFLLIVILVGCTPITTIRSDGSTVKHYMGYVRVIEPPTIGANEQFNVSEIETVGIRIVNGIGVGYFYERNEYIPLDCRLVVRVLDKEQLDNVLQTLLPITKGGLCATVSKQ